MNVKYRLERYSSVLESVLDKNEKTSVSPSTEYPDHLIDDTETYYAFDLSADEKGCLSYECQSGWAGWADDECRVELRSPSEIIARIMIHYYREFGLPFHVVHDHPTYIRWLIYGGHALITQTMAQQFIPAYLEPIPTVRTGALGFTSRTSLPDGIFRPAPTPRLRMAMLKRDEYRCRICGRRAERYVDIELHVHHIRPHAVGGPTHPDNLITLCHTCHNGLDPHYEWSLYVLREDRPDDLKSHRQKNYLAGVRRYREAVQKLLAEKCGC